jgi:hypothetical protein
MVVLGNVSGTPALERTFLMLFVSKILQYSESPWIISPTDVSKESESLIKFALDAANPPAFYPTFMKNVFHLISAAGAAE